MSYINNGNRISTDNSTNTPLGIGGVFTGTGEVVTPYSMAYVTVYASEASATDGLMIQISSDNVTWRDADSFTIPKATEKTFSFQCPKKYFRVKYTNGAAAQSTFDLQTMLKGTYGKPSSHRIQDSIVDDDDAELVKSVLTGKDDNGNFNNVLTDLGGLLRVNSFPYTYAIAEGDILDHYSLLKFGTRSTTAQNTVSNIWEGPTALYPYMTSAQQLKVVSSSASDTAAGTGTRTLQLEGLDANWDMVSETVTMNGTTQVTTSNSYIRIFRAYGGTCGTAYTNVGNITIYDNAGTTTQLYIPAGDGQTLMCMWTVPAGKTAYITNGSFSTNANKGAQVSLFTRLNDGGILYPWQIKYRAYVFSGNENFPFTIPFKVPAKTDIEIRVLTPGSAGTTSNGATFELWYED